MQAANACSIYNGSAVPLGTVPVLPFPEFREQILCATESGSRLSAFFAMQAPDDSMARLFAILADDLSGSLTAACTDVGRGYQSLTPDCPQAHWFEREIAEQYGVVPEGHPWLKPIRFHHSCRPGQDAWGRANGQTILPSVTDFFRVEGSVIHEVAVGPVHAGIIEPGHFRFQCHGEHVFSLEISLGYQHRGIEKALLGGPTPRSIHYAETLAGDTTAGHASAYCEVVEALAGINVPARSLALRAIALELERLANHTGDLGALAGDIGYLPTAAYCGRIRGDFLNMTAILCGSRFGRGLIRPGRCAFDLSADEAAELVRRLDAAAKDTANAVSLLWNTPSVLARFEGCGRVTRAVCSDLGLVGPAARACGAERDVRFSHPWGFYQFSQLPLSTWDTGDVFARAYVRWLEIQRSAAFIRDTAANLPATPEPAACKLQLRPDHLAVSLVEGWRGEICHVAITGAGGRFARYKVCDPSFHNWMGLAMALRNQPISDFPLCNKSFNLSYCGHDL